MLMLGQIARKYTDRLVPLAIPVDVIVNAPLP